MSVHLFSPPVNGLVVSALGRSATTTASATRRDAEVTARSIGHLELDGWIQALRCSLADPLDDVSAFMDRECLDAAEAERERRVRLFRAGRDVNNPDDPRYAPWKGLVREIRLRGDVVAVFVGSGYHLHDASEREAHASCLVCGGTDRLVIRRDPPGRYWCRQCGLSGDVITATRSLIPGCGRFGEAVRYLADQLGLAPPDERALLAPTEVAAPPSATPLIPIRGGGRRGR